MNGTMSEYFNINKLIREAAFRMDETHSHECYELVYLFSGECNILVSHTIYRMVPGTLVIIPPGEIHKTSYGSNDKGRQQRTALRFSIKDTDWLCSALGKDFVKDNLTAGIIEVPDKRKEYIENLITRMIYENQMPDELSMGMVKTLFQEFMIFVLRCKLYGDTSAHEIDAQNSTIQDVATYVYNNYDKQIYLDDVAKQFSISRSYLSKKFKQTTGFGFKEYLLNVRIKEACRLLLETNHSITDIAFACGFNDSNYFGDAFRRIKGISPNKYRHNRDVV